MGKNHVYFVLKEKTETGEEKKQTKHNNKSCTA